MASDSQLTPMMAQYRRIKSELPKDALLLFRLGDFYEMFFEDAQSGAQLLNVALTKRGVIPMCGIPFHAAPGYIGRLLRAGRKVAICDQVEEARPGQLVKREVTQIISPGTHFDERMLTAERNNFLAALFPFGKSFGLAFADLTTGDFMTTEVDGETALLAELQRLRPAEVIYPGEDARARDMLRGRQNSGERDKTAAAGATNFGWVLNGYDDWVFAAETALFTVRDHFKVTSLDGFGLKDRAAAIGAAGAVLHYLTQPLRRDVANLTRISFYQRSDFLALDFTTLAPSRNSRADAPGRAAHGFALRGAQPHRNADGRAPDARLAFAAAGGDGTNPAPATGGAGFFGFIADLGGVSHAACTGPGHGADDWTAEFGNGKRAGSAGVADGAGADSGD